MRHGIQLNTDIITSLNLATVLSERQLLLVCLSFCPVIIIQRFSSSLFSLSQRNFQSDRSVDSPHECKAHVQAGADNSKEVDDDFFMNKEGFYPSISLC